MTSGLDPTTSKYLADFVAELKNQGKAIVFSAHNLYQVESLCDRVLIMDRRREVACGTMAQIKKRCSAIDGKIIDIKTVEPSLEEIFLKLMG